MWKQALICVLTAGSAAALMVLVAGCDSWPGDGAESAQRTVTPTTGAQEGSDPYPKLNSWVRDMFDNYNTDTANAIIVVRISYDGDDWSAAAIMDFLAANGVPRDKASKEGSGITILAYVPVRLLGRLSQVEEVELVSLWGKPSDYPRARAPTVPPTAEKPSSAGQSDAGVAAGAGLEFTPDYEKLPNLADEVRAFATEVAEGSASVDPDSGDTYYHRTIPVSILYDEEKSSGGTIIEFLVANGFSDDDSRSDNFFFPLPRQGNHRSYAVPEVSFG